MSTLRFPTSPSDEASMEFYELKCIIPSADATTKFEIRDAKLIHCANSTVYHGTLVSDGKSRDIICKLVTTKHQMKRVIAKAGFYSNEFKKLQGVMVLHFHGLFMGEMMDEEDMTCLVLDYVGKHLTRCLLTMNAQFR
ncbi:hypothetical protein A0H81_05262 [Grifola frondosa]|uniref:Protein kinase domain-containing protein n=1 Tax=Grifola frondosa TaxID=5627 RepID=A0A1C7MEL6_GRIFR|nr:hypothetical protein A0H81_05262 [Grifola frondosa]